VRLRSAVLIPLSTLILLTALMPLPVAAGGPEWIRRQDDPAPLRDSRTFVVQGTRTADGACLFPSTPMVLPAGRRAIEQRDLRISLKLCRKVVQEGTPTDVTAPGQTRLATSGDAAHRQNLTAGSTTAATYWRKGRHHVYWTDAAGAMVNGMETHIYWFYDRACALTVHGQTTVYGYAPSGWYLVKPPTYKQWRNCTASTTSGDNAILGNTFICGREVRTTYSYVRAIGYYNGSLAGASSTDTVNECLPLFVNKRTVVYASGTGPN
jgi:hypothetical protein